MSRNCSGGRHVLFTRQFSDLVIYERKDAGYLKCKILRYTFLVECYFEWLDKQEEDLGVKAALSLLRFYKSKFVSSCSF